MHEVILNTPNLRVFAIVMEKPNVALQTDNMIFPNHYRFLLQRIDGYSYSRYRKCVVCFDSQDEGNDMIISHKMKNYLFRSAEGNECNSIVESAFFVSSRVEEGIQLADLCAGVIRKYYELSENNTQEWDFTNWVGELYRRIQEKTSLIVSPIRSQPLHGIYKMPVKFFGNY